MTIMKGYIYLKNKDDAGLENEDLHMTREQELQLKCKFSEFNAQVDMKMPDFNIGMVFFLH